MHWRSIATGILALAGVLGAFEAVLACETLHLKRIRNITPPVVTPGFAVCRTGCPFKFEGELDPGKGRWIFRKRDAANHIDAVWTVEKNLRTGEVFVTTTERSDRVCANHPLVAAAFAAGAVDVNRQLGCDVPDFKVKGVKPKVCPDQTLSCATKAQKSALVLHDWDDVDDLHRGVDVLLNIPGSPSPTAFRSAKNASPSVWFHDCCGRVDDFGQPGDPFDLQTYYAIRPAGGGGAASCFYETMRRNQRSDGEDLPDPQDADDICLD